MFLCISWGRLDDPRFDRNSRFRRNERKRFIGSVRTRKVSQPTNELLVRSERAEHGDCQGVEGLLWTVRFIDRTMVISFSQTAPSLRLPFASRNYVRCQNKLIELLNEERSKGRRVMKDEKFINRRDKLIRT